SLQARGIGPNRFGLIGISDSVHRSPHRIPVRELGTLDYYSLAKDGFAWSANHIVTGDLDQDGDVDFVTGTPLVFLNEGDGHFAPGVAYYSSSFIQFNNALALA